MIQANIGTTNLLRGRHPNDMRPFIYSDGKAYKLVHNGGDRKDPKNYSMSLVNNATLRYDEWRTLDERVQMVGRDRLIGFEDLRRNNLVYTLNNPMATTVLTWEKQSEAMEAGVGISPVSRTKNDTVDHETNHTPIPIIFSDYTIDERLLQESRMRGNALDVSNAVEAARKVSDKMEDSLFGTTSLYKYGGGTLYTYFTHPDINENIFDSGGDHWDEATKTGEEIVNDVLKLKQDSLNANQYGPWMLYISSNYETKMDKKYTDGTTTFDKTIRQSILEIGGIQDVKVVDTMPDDSVLLVQMSMDTVDLIDGMGVQNVEWSTEGGFVHNYKVMAIQVPRIRSDYNNNCGISAWATQSYK